MHPQKWFQWAVALSMLIMAGAGCSDEIRQRFETVPTAYGKVNEIVVIADKETWEGPLGDTFQYYFSSPFLILPQPEPVFDLRHFTPEDLLTDPLRKELRNYVFLADLSDTGSPTTQLVQTDLGSEKINKAKTDPTFRTAAGKDKWAKGQVLVYMFGTDMSDLTASIKNQFPAVSKRVHEADREKIEATVYLDGENRELNELVRAQFGVQMRIPGDYFKAIDQDGVLWLRKETREISSNILINKVPYRDRRQLTQAAIKALQDSLGRKYVSSEVAGSYMKTNDVDLPMIVTPTQVGNQYALEARGVWELANDFMGGPFISYLIHNEATQELILMEGFIYAPGKDKREYMQYLTHVLQTVSFPATTPN